MIRVFERNDLAEVMEIWLDANIKAHEFIPREYWTGNYAMVKDLLPQAELYVYTEDGVGEIEGFIGLTDGYIEGIFVKEAAQSRGIGKQLLDHVKGIKSVLKLSVYQKNTRAVAFYLREGFAIHSEGVDENTGEKEFLMIYEPV